MTDREERIKKALPFSIMKNQSTKQMLVLGAGTWGCTLAALLSEKGYPVTLWDSDRGIRESLRTARIPAKLPDVLLPSLIQITEDLAPALKDSRHVVIVVPSHAIRPVCEELKQIIPDMKSKCIVLFSKGIEQKTLLPPSGVVADVLGPDIRNTYCYLSGPSHAEEVARKMPTSIVASAFNPEIAREAQEIFHTDYFRIYTQEDVLGVELGAAVKNVIAIAAGVCDGLGFGDNTKAALLTRGLAEIIRLGVIMGARQETFSGLAGIGDLIVTSISRHSRNRNFGELLARGYTVEEAMKQIGMVVEGVKTADSVRALAQKYRITMPISQEVYSLIYEGKSPREALKDLMGRSLKSEIYGYNHSQENPA
jgi:glycerol-3-phosphate dehydrogenase (NAD(P)+)